MIKECRDILSKEPIFNKAEDISYLSVRDKRDFVRRVDAEEEGISIGRGIELELIKEEDRGFKRVLFKGSNPVKEEGIRRVVFEVEVSVV
ncbi:MAG: hypothetical protein AB1414_13640 [bacterium]